jgi:hypothetical protein
MLFEMLEGKTADETQTLQVPLRLPKVIEGQCANDFILELLSCPSAQYLHSAGSHSMPHTANPQDSAI